MRLTKYAKVLISLTAGCLILGALYYMKPIQLVQPKASPSATAETAASASASQAPVDDHEKTYEANKQINPDYVGELAFDSGLVDQNVVQAADNEKYLTLSWDLKDSTSGAAFMDYRNTMDDQNLIIYGHYVYRDVTMMFSPLEQLKDQKNYEANKYIELKLGNNETRKYLITDVFLYTMDDQSLEYYYTNYGEDYFKEYYAAVKKADYYDTGETLSYSDKWLSLQTCVRDHDEQREIVLAKQVTE